MSSTNITKHCKTCGTTKLKSDFYKHGGSCKACENLRTIKYAKENKHKIQPRLRGYALKQRYSITEDFYNKLLLKQENKCGICEALQCSTKRRFAVDHDHNTGKIRGLLCAKCNTGIGLFKDNQILLENAIKYLDKNA